MSNASQFFQTPLGLYLRETCLHYRSLMVRYPGDVEASNVDKAARERNVSRWSAFERALIGLCADKATANAQANRAFEGREVVELSVKFQLFESYTIKRPIFSAIKREGLSSFDRLFTIAAAEGFVLRSLKFHEGILTKPMVPAEFVLNFSREKASVARVPDEILPPPGKAKDGFIRPTGPNSTFHITI